MKGSRMKLVSPLALAPNKDTQLLYIKLYHSLDGFMMDSVTGKIVKSCKSSLGKGEVK